MPLILRSSLKLRPRLARLWLRGEARFGYLLPPPALPEPLFLPGESGAPSMGVFVPGSNAPEGPGDTAPVAPSLELPGVERPFVPLELGPLSVGLGLFVAGVEPDGEPVALEPLVWATAVPAIAMAAATARMVVFIESSGQMHR